MEGKKNFLTGKGLGYYLTIPALICGVAAVLSYKKTGITQFNPELSKTAIISALAAVALCAVSLVFEFKPVKYIAYLLFLYAFLGYVQSQVTYIANVFVSIDGNTFTPGFIITTVLYVLAFVLMLLAAALTTFRPGDKNRLKEASK